MRLRLSILAALILLPTAAFALEETPLDFRDAQVPGNWDVLGFESAVPEAGGLHLKAAGEAGRIFTKDILTQDADAVTFWVISATDVEGDFLWHTPEFPEGTLARVPFSIPAGESQQHINLIDYPSWNSRPDGYGLALPAGADVTVQAMIFHRWSPMEKAWEMASSFWKFDTWQPYSINFLWGPVLTRTSIGTAELWNTYPPPKGWSVGRILLPIFAVLAAGIFVYWLVRRDARAGAMLFAVIAVLWMGFGFRMGMELLSYAKQDSDTYLSKPAGEKRFRTLADFQDVVEQSLPELQRDPVYGLIIEPGLPVIARMRYLTYPSMPALSETELSQAKTWLVYGRPDVTVNQNGALIADGETLAASGTILKRFDESTFLYRST